MIKPSSAPVFVVGGPRSGTTLLSAMLAAHSAFYCGPETHFLSRWSRLARSEREHILDPADWPERATAYVCSLSLGQQPIYPMYQLEREEIRAWMAIRPPSLATMLESLTAQRAGRAGAPRWVEKTPRHLEVPELITGTWPHARIVRIVRDPRDAAVSLTKVPFGTPSLLTNLSVLARMNEAAADFYRSSDAALTVRYEDLVAAPERELRRICEFVGGGLRAGHARGPQRRYRCGCRPRVVEGRCHRPARPIPFRPLGRRRCRQPSSTTPRSTSAPCWRNMATARPCRPSGSWPSCPPGDALNARYDEVLLQLAAG